MACQSAGRQPAARGQLRFSGCRANELVECLSPENRTEEVRPGPGAKNQIGVSPCDKFVAPIHYRHARGVMIVENQISDANTNVDARLRLPSSRNPTMPLLSAVASFKTSA
jgi:hypothetical protein